MYAIVLIIHKKKPYSFLFQAKPDYIKVQSIGKTVENRDTNVISITKAGKGKPNIWVESGEM